MNAQIKKEIRLLLPAWAAAMILAIVPVWIARDVNDLVCMGAYLGFALLGIAVYGQEFSFGTFSLLLAQPAPRMRTWRIKAAVLAMAFILVFIGGVGSRQSVILFWPTPLNPLQGGVPASSLSAVLYGWFALGALVAFASGVLAALLVRQVTAAFWFSLLVPLAIALPLGWLNTRFPEWPERNMIYLSDAVFAVYSIAAFFLARGLFVRAQDLQWTGGNISFSWAGKRAERATAPRAGSWLSALVSKELHLHQVNIIIAGVVLVLNLVSIFLRKFPSMHDDKSIREPLEFVWAIWLLLPALIGSAAVAEERKLGVSESQLCMPVARGAQLCVKFAVALALSLVFGVMMPCLLESSTVIPGVESIATTAIASFIIFFYASTLVRTTIQAIGIAIAFSAGIWACLYAGTSSANVTIEDVHHFYDEMYSASGMLALVLAWLAYGNFARLDEQKKLWRRNIIVAFAALILGFALGDATYNRDWELLTSVEPGHGAALLRDSSGLRMAGRRDSLNIRLPDGRIWVARYSYLQGFHSVPNILDPSEDTREYIGGSNWVDVAADFYRTLAIQSDGSLWRLPGPGVGARSEVKLARIGTETNWSHLAGGKIGFLLLKNDGSLWIWGTNGLFQSATNWSARSLSARVGASLNAPAERIGTETNWSEVFSVGDEVQQIAEAKTSDGGIWDLVLDQGGAERGRPWTATLHQIEEGSDWRFLDSTPPYNLGVKTNGELWYGADFWVRIGLGHRGKIQLEPEAKWKSAVLLLGYSVAGLRTDGTLWQWPYRSFRLMRLVDGMKPVQLGNHSDWVALWAPDNQLAISLAADGGLWGWRQQSEYEWLAPSRKPVFLGNIFEAKK